jgi:hypothetical protein
MREWSESGALSLDPDQGVVATLSRRAQTGVLAQLLDEVAQRPW